MFNFFEGVTETSKLKPQPFTFNRRFIKPSSSQPKGQSQTLKFKITPLLDNNKPNHLHKGVPTGASDPV